MDAGRTTPGLLVLAAVITLGGFGYWFVAQRSATDAVANADAAAPEQGPKAASLEPPAETCVLEGLETFDRCESGPDNCLKGSARAVDRCLNERNHLEYCQRTPRSGAEASTQWAKSRCLKPRFADTTPARKTSKLCNTLFRQLQAFCANYDL